MNKSIHKQISAGFLATICSISMIGIPVVMPTMAHAETVTQEVPTESITPSLELRLEDENGNALDGSFGIYADSQCITSLQNSDSNKGLIYFSKTLEEGKTYYIKQTKATDGYAVDNQVHTFVLEDISPSTETVSFKFDGKTYGMGDNESYRVYGAWGDMTISLKFVNYKDQASGGQNSGTDGGTTGDTSVNASNPNETKTTDGADTGAQTNAKLYGVLGGGSILGILCAAIYKWKKGGDVSEKAK